MSVSSSRTGTRPTWASQTATDRSRPGSSTVTVSGRPFASWTRPSGSRRQVVVGVVVLLVAVGVDRLAEVALAVEQPDADERQGHVAGRLHVVAGEDAEAARVDAERLVEAVLGAEVGDRARRARRRAGAGTSGRSRWPCSWSNSAQDVVVLGQELRVVEQAGPLGRAADDRDRVAVAGPGRPVDEAPQVRGSADATPSGGCRRGAGGLRAGAAAGSWRPGSTGRGRGPCGAHDSRLGRRM